MQRAVIIILVEPRPNTNNFKFLKRFSISFELIANKINTKSISPKIRFAQI